MTEAATTDTPTRSLVEEISAIRKRDVDADVRRRIDRARGDCTSEQIEAWVAEAYREWRRRWPILNNQLFAHGEIGRG